MHKTHFMSKWKKWLRRRIYIEIVIDIRKLFSVWLIWWCPEAESKEKHGVWDHLPELTITSPCEYVHSRDSHTLAMSNLIPESTLTLCQSRLCPPVRDFGFGLRRVPNLAHVQMFNNYIHLYYLKLCPWSKIFPRSYGYTTGCRPSPPPLG